MNPLLVLLSVMTVVGDDQLIKPTKVDPDRACILVTCPPGTVLYVSDYNHLWQVIDDGMKEGRYSRDFLTPVLDPEKRYGYLFRAKLPDGRVIEKKVVVWRGRQIDLVFP